MKKIYLKNNFIENYLLRNNKNLKWLSEKLCLSSCYLSLILNKKRSLSPKIREKIIKFSGLKFDDLFVIIEEK